MSRIFVSGDYHGNYDGEARPLSNKYFADNKSLTKDDVIIFLGDFSLPWFSDPIGQRAKKEKKGYFGITNLKATIFVILGNHDNYHLIYQMPIIDKWGGKVYVYEHEDQTFYYAIRGEIYTINDKTFFTFNGAMSDPSDERLGYKDYLAGSKIVNKYRYGELVKRVRKKISLQHVNYWEEELATQEEKDIALENLKKIGFKVDYVLTHTAPLYILKKISKVYALESRKIEDPTTEFLDEVAKILTFKEWHFGHLHIDFQIKEGNRLYYCHFKKPPHELCLQELR